MKATKTCKLLARSRTEWQMWHGATSMIRVGWQNACQGANAAAIVSRIWHMTVDVFQEEANLQMCKEAGAEACKSRQSFSGRKCLLHNKNDGTLFCISLFSQSTATKVALPRFMPWAAPGILQPRAFDATTPTGALAGQLMHVSSKFSNSSGRSLLLLRSKCFSHCQ